MIIAKSKISQRSCCTNPKVMTKMFRKCSTDQRFIRKRNTTYKIHTLVTKYVYLPVSWKGQFNEVLSGYIWEQFPRFFFTGRLSNKIITGFGAIFSNSFGIYFVQMWWWWSLIKADRQSIHNFQITDDRFLSHFVRARDHLVTIFVGWVFLSCSFILWPLNHDKFD